MQDISGFINKQLNKGSEKGNAQVFWLELLHDVLDIESPAEFIEFEKTVTLSHKSYIDAYIPSTKILIEQKTINSDLTKPALQSDGTYLTPFEQAKRYRASILSRYQLMKNTKFTKVSGWIQSAH